MLMFVYEINDTNVNSNFMPNTITGAIQVQKRAGKSCTNDRHGAWRSCHEWRYASIYPLMVNLKAKVGASNVFFKAFK